MSSVFAFMKKMTFCLLLAYGTSNSVNAADALDKDGTGNLLKNGVIVRVWSSMLTGGENVGHVSLQTNQDYISFWPAPTASSKTGCFNTFEQDYGVEKREPEITIFLKNPSSEVPDLLRQDFTFLKSLLEQGKLSWTLNGQGQKLKTQFSDEHYRVHCENAKLKEAHFLGFYENWSFNCSSLVYNLLSNKNYLEGNPLAGLTGLNSCMSPDQVAQACSLSFMHENWGPNYRAFFESALIKKGVKSVLSFQEKYVGYFLFKSMNKKVHLNLNFIDDAARCINEINSRDNILVPLMGMLSSLGLSEIFTSLVGSSVHKK